MLPLAVSRAHPLSSGLSGSLLAGVRNNNGFANGWKSNAFTSHTGGSGLRTWVMPPPQRGSERRAPE
eukprot:4249714-Pyramimonas_sp.AAC.1